MGKWNSSASLCSSSFEESNLAAADEREPLLGSSNTSRTFNNGKYDNINMW